MGDTVRGPLFSQTPKFDGRPEFLGAGARSLNMAPLPLFEASEVWTLGLRRVYKGNRRALKLRVSSKASWNYPEDNSRRFVATLQRLRILIGPVAVLSSTTLSGIQRA